MDYVTQIIDPPPSRSRLLLDGVLGLRKPKLEGEPTLPKERLVRSAVELSTQGSRLTVGPVVSAVSKACRCPIPMCWRSPCT